MDPKKIKDIVNQSIEKVKADGTFGRQRLYVGKTRDRESAVMLNESSVCRFDGW